MIKLTMIASEIPIGDEVYIPGNDEPYVLHLSGNDIVLQPGMGTCITACRDSLLELHFGTMTELHDYVHPVGQPFPVDPPKPVCKHFVSKESANTLTKENEEFSTPNKGQKGGECNITTCNTPDAQWYNHSTQKFYCDNCAYRLNNDPFNKRDSEKLWGT